MNKILLNEDTYKCSENDLPLLIHGEDKAGASLFTITFAANLFTTGSKLLFLTGYEMAREEFVKQIGISHVENNDVIFCFKDSVNQFIEYLNTLSDINERIVIVKNIDLFNEEIFHLISNKQKIILSGDINKCGFKKAILGIKFKTKVMFSTLEGEKIPELQKYQGFLMHEDISGVATVAIV
jgi:hypothetical protein